MMVSNGNRDSKMEAGWDDALPYGKTFIEAAPDRTIWGTDAARLELGIERGRVVRLHALVVLAFVLVLARVTGG